jgi:hypothetical protein
MTHLQPTAESCARRDIQQTHEFLLTDDTAVVLNNRLDIEQDRYDRVYLDSQDYNKTIKSYQW